MSFAIESDKLCAFGLCAHNNLVSLHHIGIEAVHRLSVCHHDVIGNIDNVVDWTNADSVEPIFKPFRRLHYVTIRHTQAYIAFASFGILDFYINGQVMIVDIKCIARRAVQTCFVTILTQPCIQVACYTPV